MMTMLRSALLALASTCAVALSACGPLQNNISGTGSAATNLRIIDGSPDAGPLDFRIDSPTGLLAASSATYGTVAPAVQLSGVAHLVEILPPGGTTPTLTCTTPAMAPAFNYTIVVAGSAKQTPGSTTGLQCQFFAEPAFSTPSGSYTINVHHAAVLFANAGTPAISFGTFPPGTTNYGGVAGTATLVSALTNNTANTAGTQFTATGVTTPPGIGFWFAPSTSSAPTKVTTTFLPSQGKAGYSGASGASDTGNILPTGSLINLDLYILDAQSGSGITLIGLYD